MGFERPSADAQHQVLAILRGRHGESCFGTNPHFAAPGQTQNRSLQPRGHGRIAGKPAARFYHRSGSSGDDRNESRLHSLGESRDGGSLELPPGLGHGMHANQQPLTLGIAAVAHGMDQVHDHAGHRRSLLKLIYAHRGHLRAAHLDPFVGHPVHGMGKVDDQPGRAVEELNRGLGSLAGNDFESWSFRVGDHFHRTQDRRRAFGDREIIGRLRQASAGAQRSHQQRGPYKLAGDTRQKLHLSETGVIAATISPPVGSREVTNVGHRTSDFGRQASDLGPPASALKKESFPGDTCFSRKGCHGMCKGKSCRGPKSDA